MGININDLSPLSTSLLSDNESLLGNIRDLLTEELKISGGGGYGGDDDDDDGKGHGKGHWKGCGKGHGKGHGKGYGCGGDDDCDD